MEIAVLLALLVTNGLFAMSEMALVSSKSARLTARADDGDNGAAVALDLLKDPSRLLSTVQIGITLVGVFAGAFGAAAFSDDLAPVIAKAFPKYAASADDAAFAIVVIAITYLSLIIGELVPKRIALAAPELIASVAARPMKVIAFIAYPAVAMLRFSTETLIFLMGLSGVKPDKVSEEEILHMVAEGATSGAIDKKERDMIEGVLDLADRNVRSVMTPRFDVVWLDAAATSTQILKEIADGNHSRFPIVKSDTDEIVGIVQTKDLLNELADSGAIDLAAAMKKPIFVPETMSVTRMLEELAQSDVRMAIVVDEHGEFSGVATAADILGAIAGADAFAPGDRLAAMQKRADGSWLVDGMTPIEDFERVIGQRDLVDPANYATIAGLVMHRIQRIAEPGDIVTIGGLSFEVADLDGRRIDKVIVSQSDDGEALDI